ncbi:hypothetical protein CkaCkLH20_12198 [Colletotrichum karsti]|uniref:Uncharacterized protein n=1 Tax=Colletotrichum karsti TaxID=1095194 RepID=A0A9P6HXY0_9PEZI|nr:uncharacterized protein CkaCkLH20_12198 [Colletotrichum karsti]KAF9870351.1 hypothetical protein CkaCkLH20_12198 [Colletotrichum karsti]
MCIPRPRRHRSSSSTTSPITNLPYDRLESPPPTPRMAPKPLTTTSAMPTIGMPGPSSARVSSQHERLLLELLPFKEASKFHEWLDSPFVRGPWNEFHADFLLRCGAASGGGPSGGGGGAGIPEPDKARTAQAAREALNSKKPKFLVYHPDKTGWTAEDHYVRFIITLVADNLLQNLWYESEWKKRGLDIAKAAYEVLIFLKATLYVDPSPPSYSA